MLRLCRVLRATAPSGRDEVVGPGGLGSLTRFGKLHVNHAVPEHMRRVARLENQSRMKQDTRERRYAICTKCGVTTLTVNFDKMPSARLGIFGECADGQDYTHHRWSPLTGEEYKSLATVPFDKRVDWYLFRSGRE